MILVTGAAGFIGFHVASKLLKEGYQVIGLDNLNSYYDVKLKKSRLEILSKSQNFTFLELHIHKYERLKEECSNFKIEKIVHLAAQAGVRYSIENPFAYAESNLVGFTSILELARLHEVKNLVYASTSSVYGANTNLPFSEKNIADHPIQFYAATKRANELMAHSYSSLFNLPTIGLRFFTVYGPWGRPDMALFKFTKKILADEPIDVFNHGNHIRDFTYVDDIVNGIILAMNSTETPTSKWDPSNPKPHNSIAPYRIYNIGNSQPVTLMEYINQIETFLGKKASINFLPLQKGDVVSTESDISLIHEDLGYMPTTSIEQGIHNFLEWYQDYYRGKK
jgi:UDP-glucuronate 4-epimerase